MSRQHHYLKILPKHFMDIESGKKPFEVRFNDRNYQTYDILHLEEWFGGEYSGREIIREVSYMLDDPDYCKEGYVIMALKEWKEITCISATK